MHISQLLIENFRIFGAGDNKLVIPLTSGLTALVGENDEGKSAIIDALRFVLGTKDQFYSRIEHDDYHRWLEKENGLEKAGFKTAESMWIQCQFSGLSVSNQGAFAEYLTYETDGSVSLYVNWIAHKDKKKTTRRWAEVCSGKEKDGPLLHAEVRELLRATYLRPLRDAEREMSSGRNSRLSQILLATEDIQNTKDDQQRTILNVSDNAFEEIEEHPALNNTSANLNSMLKGLSFQSDVLQGGISVNQHADATVRLKQLLEKLKLDLTDAGTKFSDNRGLGSNNLLYMGCEMLLLETAHDELPIMLIEEPEAHLHPQRQLLIIEHLQNQAERENIQIIVTTHSPLLASVIQLKNLVMIKDQKAFPLGPEYTELCTSDYSFLERFLDATKANLFFAKGVMVVEGDAENILLPTIAKLLGKDFTKNGVSVVNVGHTGLGRFARIFMRKKTERSTCACINIPVACLADLDVLPSSAPGILGLDPTKVGRKWKYEDDYENGALEQRRTNIKSRVAGQNVRTFVSKLWTLEFDIANSDLLEEEWLAARLALDDDKMHNASLREKVTICKKAKEEFAGINDTELNLVDKAVHCYSRYTSNETEYAGGKTKVSKSISAQYLAGILLKKYKGKPGVLRGKLPEYIVDAIDYVTGGKPNA